MPQIFVPADYLCDTPMNVSATAGLGLQRTKTWYVNAAGGCSIGWRVDKPVTQSNGSVIMITEIEDANHIVLVPSPQEISEFDDRCSCCNQPAPLVPLTYAQLCAVMASFPNGVPGEFIVKTAGGVCSSATLAQVQALLTPPAFVETPFVANDSNTIDFTNTAPLGHVLTGTVKLSATAGNQVSANADGLFVPAPAAETPFVANDSSTVDLTNSGPFGHVLTAAVKVSAAPGNQVAVNADGVFVPPAAAETPFVANDSSTIDFTTSGALGHILTGAAKLSAVAGNALTVNPDGLYVAPASIGTDVFVQAGAYDPNTNILTLTLTNGSTIPINMGTLLSDVPQTPLTANDSSSLDFTTSGPDNHTLTGTVKLSSAAGNQIITNADGLFVAASSSGAQTPLVANDSSTLDFTTSGADNHTLTGVVKLSATAGNQVSANADGLFVPAPAAETPLILTDSATIDFSQSGTANHTGTGVVKVSGTAGNMLEVDAGGLLVKLDCADLTPLIASLATPACPPTTYLRLGTGVNCLESVPFNTPTRTPAAKTATQATVNLTSAAIAAACPASGGAVPDPLTFTQVATVSHGAVLHDNFAPNTAPSFGTFAVVAGRMYRVAYTSNVINTTTGNSPLTDVLNVVPSGGATVATVVPEATTSVQTASGTVFEVLHTMIFRAVTSGSVTVGIVRSGAPETYGIRIGDIVEIRTASGQLPTLVASNIAPIANGTLGANGGITSPATIATASHGQLWAAAADAANSLTINGATSTLTSIIVPEAPAAGDNQVFYSFLDTNSVADYGVLVSSSLVGNIFWDAAAGVPGAPNPRGSAVGFAFSAVTGGGGTISACPIGGPGLTLDILNPNVCPAGTGATLQPVWRWMGAQVRYIIPAGNYALLAFNVDGVALNYVVDNLAGTVPLTGTWVPPSQQGILANVAAGGTSTAVVVTSSTAHTGNGYANTPNNIIQTDVGSILITTGVA